MNNGNKDDKRNFGPKIQIIPGPMHTSLQHTGLDNKMRIAANQNVASQDKRKQAGGELSVRKPSNLDMGRDIGTSHKAITTQ